MLLFPCGPTSARTWLSSGYSGCENADTGQRPRSDQRVWPGNKQTFPLPSLTAGKPTRQQVVTGLELLVSSYWSLFRLVPKGKEQC